MATKPLAYIATATLRDSEGRSSQVKANFTALSTVTIAQVDTEVNGWAQAVANMSYASLWRFSWSSISGDVLVLPAPVTGVTDSNRDKAFITFSDASGKLYKMELPAPLEAIFTPDGETVDPAGTALVALEGILTVVGTHLTWTTTQGEGLKQQIQGYRLRRHGRRVRQGIATEQGGE